MWRGRVALPRDRRCTFKEDEQAKGVNVGWRAAAQSAKGVSKRATPVARERNPTASHTPTRRYADTFFTQLSVPQMNPPLPNLRDLAAVCDHNQRRQMLIGNMLENLQHFFRIGTVEVPRRFVGQQQIFQHIADEHLTTLVV